MNYLALFIAFTFLIILLVFALYLAYSLLFQVPFYPSRTKHLKEALDVFGIKLNGKNFVDLGSGDGRVVMFASSLGANGHGIESNPFLSLWSRVTNFLLRKNSKFYNQNFFNHDFSKYDIVYLYLYREVMDQMLEKLLIELNENAVIISNTFAFSKINEDEKYKKFRIYKIKNVRTSK